MRLCECGTALFGSLRAPAHIYGPEAQRGVYIFIWAVQLTGPPVDYADATGMDAREKKAFYLGIARLFV